MRLPVLLLAGFSLLVPAPCVAADSEGFPPCAACAAVAAGAPDGPTLAAAGVRLDGVDLVFDQGAPSAAVRVALQALGGRVWVRVATDAETADLSGLAGAWLVAPVTGTDEQVVFDLRRRATELRAGAPGLAIGLVVESRLNREELARSLAPYVDAVRVSGDGSVDTRDLARWFPGAELWRDVVAADVVASTDPAVARTVVHAPDPARAARQVAALSALLVPGLTSLPEAHVSCGGCRASAFLHPDSLHAIVVVEASAGVASARIGPAAVSVSLVDLDAPAPPVVVPVTGDEVRIPGARRFVLDIGGWRGAEDTVFRDVVRVSAARTLSVGEVLARHQAWRARQAALVRTVISSGTTVIAFDVPGFAGPATVTARTRTFRRGSAVEMEQREIRMNGVDLEVDGRAPTLPIVEPERVMTPPLVITLGAAYEYRLAGRDRIDGRECYVVAFHPREPGAQSFEGRAWIDASSFALARIDAVQTGLRGAIVSARQRDEFAPVAVGAREAWLPTRSTSDQVYQAPGFRTPIHREMVTASHDVNAADFDTRRDAALRSRAVILRDTPRGYEYLVPARCAGGGTACGGEAARVPAPRAGRRVVTLAFGVIDDPNISVPLPYAGLSYLDFDLFGRGIQFSGFFGGSYGQAAWTVPGVFRRGWQLTGRAFGIAARYNDRSFRDGLERYDENVQQRPAHVDASLVVPVTPRVQLRAGYELDYTAFRANAETAPDFAVPADAVVHGARIALDVQRGSWSALAWWNPARRQGWRAWGRPGGEGHRAGGATFQRYGVTVARAWVLSPGSVARAEASWVDGHDLDRFSRYSVDGFDNRLRGYPSASLRYDRGAVLRGVATWTPVGRVRIDGFADLAAVHDPGFGRGVKGYPGVGATAEIPLPARCLLSVEWGYGFEGRNTDGSRGTQVIRLAGIKVF